MIIDFHTHTFPDKIAAAAIEKLSKRARIHPFSDGTADGLAASAKAAGIDLSVVLPVATHTKQVTSINDYAAKTNETTGTTGLFSFGCIHPDYPEWKEELSRIAALGLKGIKLHPVYQEVDFDDLRYLRILERAGELGLVVVTHSGLDIGYPGVEHCTPEMILNAVKQVGPVKLVLAHMGGWRQWAMVEELLVGQPVWFDTSFSVGKVVLLKDECHSPEELSMLDEIDFLHMIRKFGIDRVLFGTDSPWSDQKASLDLIRALPLGDDEKDAILSGNAGKLLEISC